MLISCGSPLSLQPLSSLDSAIYDERLSGGWQSTEGDIFLHIGREVDNKYRIVAIDYDVSNIRVHNVIAFVSVLEAGNFINIKLPEELTGIKENKDYYAFLRYEIKDPDTLRMFFLDEEVIKKAIEKGELKGNTLDKDVLITDTSENIIRFIESYESNQLFIQIPDFKRFTKVYRDYFPENVFDSHSRKWYSRHLRFMDEPSLPNLIDDDNRQVYRFLWLRSFDEPIAIRLTVNSSGTGSLTIKMLNGRGGYSPGELVRDETTAVTKEEIEGFISLLQKANYWELSTNEKSDVYGFDGARWIIEGMTTDKYHVVDRWSPEEGDFREACLYLLRLSNLKVRDKDIY